jgi:hypothetical protein
MAAYDPYYADVVLLLRGNGTNDSQTITDERAHTVIVNGNTCIKTATKKYGTGSIYFDGAGDYLEIAPADFVFGTGDFTAEAWVYLTDVANTRPIFGNRSVASGAHWALEIVTSGKLRLSFANTNIETSVSVPTGQWAYVAASKSGGRTRLYINGIKYADDSGTFSGFGFGTSLVNVRVGATQLGPKYFYGYIDDARLTKYGRYTGDTHRVPAFEAPITNTPPDITLTSITPHKGPTAGGTLVTVEGSGFTDYTTCTIDGNSLTTITTVSDTELTGYTPPGTVGLKDVVVTNP